MLSTEQALAKILGLMRVSDTEEIPLRLACGRVLAHPARAERNQPPFRSSAMDGYACRSADVRLGTELKIIGQSQAGQAFAGQVGQGQAVRIFTGAPVPDGADQVIIQEDADSRDDALTIHPDHDPALHIRAEGSDFRQGDEFAARKRLSPADIGLLAAMNIAAVTVRRKPVIALIATGDELVMPGEIPGGDQIIASNGLALAALLEQHGAHANLLPIARDTKASLRAAFACAEGCDLIVTIGGASVGDHDLVQATAVDLGLEVEFWKVAMRPGKPLIAGTLNDSPFLGLPGNPVSAMVCGHIFLRPALDAMLDLPAGPLPRLRGRLQEAIAATGPREHYMRGTATSTATGWRLSPSSRQDSSLFAVLARSNALIVAPPNQPALPAGAACEFILL